MPTTRAIRQTGPGPGRISYRDPKFRYAMVPDKLLAERNEDVNDRAKTIWAVYARILASGSTDNPTREEVGAAAGGCSPDTVDRANNQLIQHGWLVVYQYGTNQPNGYELVSEPEDQDERPSVAERIEAHRAGGAAKLRRQGRKTADSLLSVESLGEEVLPPDSDESAGSRSKPRYQRLANPRPKREPRPGWNRESDFSSGREDEPVLGADHKPPVNHRQASGAGLAAQFKRKCTLAFANQKLAAGQYDLKKMASVLSRWINAGEFTGPEIGAMIDIWCADAKPIAGSSLWQGFLGSRHRLYPRALEYLTSTAPAEDRYRVPPPPEPKSAMQYLVK